MGRLMARLREEQIVCRIYALRVIMVSAHLPSDKGRISFCPMAAKWHCVWAEMARKRKVLVARCFHQRNPRSARSIRVVTELPLPLPAAIIFDEDSLDVTGVRKISGPIIKHSAALSFSLNF